MGKARHTDGDKSHKEGLYGLMRSAGFKSIQHLSDHSGVSVRTIFDYHHRVYKNPRRSTVKLLALSLEIEPEKVRKVVGLPK
tara:strand:+ start:418 stop:663 length:246 start_codon:yes stop_codon:yes gene_type:complete